MKKIVLTLLSFAVLSISAFAQTDSLQYRKAISQLSQDIEKLQKDNNAMAASNAELTKKIANLEKQVQVLKDESNEQRSKVSALEAGVSNNEETIKSKTGEINEQLCSTNKNIDAQGQSIKAKTTWGVIIAIFILLVSALLSLFLHKKGNTKIEDLKKQSDELNAEIVNRLSSEMADMQKISTSIGSLQSSSVSNDNEQSLIKALADRITFMEMTLYKMDSSVRGYKQLNKSIAQMKDNLKANGYEIVDMLGSEYHEGMKVTASFIEDEDIEQGKQIITGITKPQINYQGQMIQAAQITVSQNS